MKTPLETTENDEIKQENLDEISNLGASHVGIILDSKYEIKREIARGGMGIVYEAYHKYTYQKVAIKIILAGIVDPIQLKRFQKELEAYSLLSHPNVITIHDAGIYKNYPYIVMEYIEGVDICTYVKQQEEQNKQEDSESGEARGRDWKLCARLIYETALGLDYIHSKKMIHRDIKPANILVRSNGNPVIIDLGIVKFNRTQSYNLTRSKETIGTFEYMPIEQAKGKGEQIDERTDVYSLGLVLYELLTGQRAYSGENIMELCYKIMFFYPPLPREIDAQIPEVLEKITIHAIEKQREKRYASMKEFADELKQYLDDTIVKSSSQYTQNKSNEEETLELATQFSNEQNFTKAFKLYEKSAKQGNAEAQLYLGIMYYNGQGVKQDYAKAVYWYEKSAKQGNIEAQLYLGIMYYNGQGVEQDYEKVVYWYEKSAKQGIAKAQFYLGSMYEKGQGIEQNYAKAVYWYEKSAILRHTESQFYLGSMYEKGQGVKQDYAKAVYWYEKSANQGLADAQSNLGVMYQYGQGVTQDYEKAVYWYEKSANQGFADAQSNLGVMYYNAQGVKQDFFYAVYWYEKSAIQGHSQAQFYLGLMYYNGQGVKQDFSKAVYWYEKSAIQGHSQAQNMLGVMYDCGLGVKQDYKKAYELYEESANQGNAEAQFNLGSMYYNGQGVKQNFSYAIYWYKKSAIQGLAKAQFYLGSMYDYGQGVKQNFSKAHEWYEKSAIQGFLPAQEKLKELKERLKEQ